MSVNSAGAELLPLADFLSVIGGEGEAARAELRNLAAALNDRFLRSDFWAHSGGSLLALIGNNGQASWR